MIPDVSQTLYSVNRLLDLAQNHLALGRPEMARQVCQQAFALHPDNLEAPYLLSRISAQEGDFVAAADLIATVPTMVCDAAFLRDYYQYHQKAGRLDRAVTFFRSCVQRQPDSYSAWYYLASTCLGLQQSDGFLQAALRAGRLRQDAHGSLFDLAELYEQADVPTQVERHLRRCLQLAPVNKQYLNSLANTLKRMGRANESVEYYAALVDTEVYKRADHGYYTNFLMNFICTTVVDPEEIFEKHRHWGELCCRDAGEPPTAFSNTASAVKRLRIGYVSSDFCRHPVAFFIEPLLTMHDQSRFEVFLYANVEHEDNVTEQIRQRPCNWRQICGVPDEEVCRMIREDGIDILVDLGGQTRRNRLPVFARRPAPVQVTWLGYAHSSGLATIDYRFTDAVADPPGMTEHLHTEQLYRLPDSFLGYHPPLDPPDILPLPSARNNVTTFVAFNSLAKSNDQLLAWWAEILKQVPGSRLQLKDAGFSRDYRFREEWLDRFAALGITVDRIDLLDRAPTIHKHLELLGQGDIFLDAYPYNGTTTTNETIWMGVPVVTLAGPSHVSRVSASLLTCVGAPELIAHTPEEYIEKAVRLAADQERLQFYRANLRSMMQASALMDFEGFARKIEAAYRDIWGKWCLSYDGGTETNGQLCNSCTG